MGQVNGGEGGAAVKGVVPHHGQAVGQGDAGQLSAALEGAVADHDHRAALQLGGNGHVHRCLPAVGDDGLSVYNFVGQVIADAGRVLRLDGQALGVIAASLALVAGLDSVGIGGPNDDRPVGVGAAGAAGHGGDFLVAAAAARLAQDVEAVHRVGLAGDGEGQGPSHGHRLVGKLRLIQNGGGDSAGGGLGAVTAAGEVHTLQDGIGVAAAAHGPGAAKVKAGEAGGRAHLALTQTADVDQIVILIALGEQGQGVVRTYQSKAVLQVPGPAAQRGGIGVPIGVSSHIDGGDPSCVIAIPGQTGAPAGQAANHTAAVGGDVAAVEAVVQGPAVGEQAAHLTGPAAVGALRGIRDRNICGVHTAGGYGAGGAGIVNDTGHFAFQATVCDGTPVLAVGNFARAVAADTADEGALAHSLDIAHMDASGNGDAVGNAHNSAQIRPGKRGAGMGGDNVARHPAVFHQGVVAGGPPYNAAHGAGREAEGTGGGGVMNIPGEVAVGDNRGGDSSGDLPHNAADGGGIAHSCIRIDSGIFYAHIPDGPASERGKQAAGAGEAGDYMAVAIKNPGEGGDRAQGLPRIAGQVDVGHQNVVGARGVRDGHQAGSGVHADVPGGDLSDLGHRRQKTVQHRRGGLEGACRLRLWHQVPQGSAQPGGQRQG